MIALSYILLEGLKNPENKHKVNVATWCWASKLLNRAFKVVISCKDIQYAGEKLDSACLMTLSSVSSLCQILLCKK